MPPLNIENDSFFSSIPHFNINLLKPYIEEDGIILFGAGDNCVKFLTSLFLRGIQAKILCVADMDENKKGKSILGFPVVAIEELRQFNKEIPILITPTKGFKQITNELHKMRFNRIFYYDYSACKYSAFINQYMQKNSQGECYYNFGGALLPDVDELELLALLWAFVSTFYISLFHNDSYDKSVVEALNLCFNTKHYGFTDGSFDVTVKKGDVVIDGGAWIGDFSAYAANKGAEVYAFEPTSTTYALLEQTVKLNRPHIIYPVKKGLSNKTEETLIVHWDVSSAGNSLVMPRAKEVNSDNTEKISLTTLDAFVAERSIRKVDFIKANIEGAERDMLIGATEVLKIFAPKLAISTNHLPDDPRVLEDIIMKINPKYRIVHLNSILYAQVMDE